MTCLTPEQIEMLVRGEAAPQSAADLQKHCEQCEACRRRVEAAQADEQLVRKLRDLPLTETPLPPTGPAAGVPLAGQTTQAHPKAGPPQPRTTQVGPYRILRKIGAGGMGVVYEAQQDHPQRMVALKIIRLGFATPAQLRRFELEGQVLGRLQHPGIAQIFEAGTAKAKTGPQPYFVMELVRGRSLTEYAKERGLNVRQRLELFAQICDAVQHAHQKGVIHRDLKPGNILVTEEGQPKILDFGVARLTDFDLQVTTVHTDIGQLIGTIPYMSPEQVGGDPNELDTRSDVYALGVVLYELLAGRLPHDLSGRLIPEAVRIIKEDEPTRLSSISRTLRGDVETIVGKALEKEKDRRYASAAELASDIRRHLRNDPIMARAPSAVYQLGKFAKRHRALVSGVAAVFVLLLAGVVTISTLYVRAEDALRGEARQRKLAEQSRVETQQVAKFQSSMLSGIDVQGMGRTIVKELRNQVELGLRRRWGEAHDGTMRRMTEEEIATALGHFDDAVDPVNPTDVARQMLDATVLRPATVAIDRDFAGQPEIEASLCNTIGNIYQTLGLYDAAEEQLRKALEIRQQIHGEEHPDVARSLNNLAESLQCKGDYAAAEPLYRRALEMRRKHLGDEDRDVATSLANLASLLKDKGDYVAAESLCREALAVFRKLLGEEHADVAASLNNLALLLQAKEDYAAAEPLYREALAINRKLLGNEHRDVATSLNNLALLLQFRGKHAEAEPLYREALAMRRRLLGDEHPDVATSLNNLAALLHHRKGDYAAAKALYCQALATQRKLLGNKHPNVAISLDNLARLLRATGEYAAAEPLYREALTIRRQTLPPGDSFLAATMAGLAHTLAKLGRYAEAEPLHVAVFKSVAGEAAAPGKRVRQTYDHLIELYDAWDTAEPDKGYDAKAGEWRAKLAEWQATTQPADDETETATASEPAFAPSGEPPESPPSEARGSETNISPATEDSKSEDE